MYKERNKFLTEAMGICFWGPGLEDSHSCSKCCDSEGKPYTWYKRRISPVDFSTPENFFKLWNWAYDKQVWTPYNPSSSLIQLVMRDSEFGHKLSLINPDKFADRLYECLKKEIL